MSFIITAKVIGIVFSILLLNFILFAVGSYLDIRYLESSVDSYDDTPFIVPFMFGFIIFTMFIFGFLHKKIIIDIKSPHRKIIELAKKHKQQDKDVNYQLEKYFLDKK